MPTLPELPTLPTLPVLPTLPAPLDRLLRRAVAAWTATGRHEPGAPLAAVVGRLENLKDQDTTPGEVRAAAQEFLAASAAHRQYRGGAA